MILKPILYGLLAALLTGLLTGWARYWIGCFLIAQGALCGFAVAWIVKKTKSDGNHPGFKTALLWSTVLLLVFIAAQTLSFGIAQPWFDPFGWIQRVINGHTAEFMFGIASTAGVNRGFALGVKGWFWLVFNLIDWLIMFAMLMLIPWSSTKTSSRPKA